MEKTTMKIADTPAMFLLIAFFIAFVIVSFYCYSRAYKSLCILILNF